MTSPPSPSSVRVTITVTPEVHAAYQRLAKASSMSLSRAMGEWLGDTIEAAEFMATKMEQARAAPGIVMREMHAYALGLADETGALIEKVKEEGRKSRAAASGSATPGAAAIPPVGNTGGKGPQTTQGKHQRTPPRQGSK